MPDLYTSAALPAGQAGTVVGANLVTQYLLQQLLLLL